jgi:hypothetical protein
MATRNPEKERRLAEALRANLRKRKAAGREEPKQGGEEDARKEGVALGIQAD